MAQKALVYCKNNIQCLLMKCTTFGLFKVSLNRLKGYYLKLLFVDRIKMELQQQQN